MKTKRNILEIYFERCSVYVDVSDLQNLDTQLKKSEIIGTDGWIYREYIQSRGK